MFSSFSGKHYKCKNYTAKDQLKYLSERLKIIDILLVF